MRGGEEERNSLVFDTNRHAVPSDAVPAPQIRRRYRNLITKEHPDKGGDADKFAAIQRAYDVLSNAAKRAKYDETGVAERSADEELMDAFGGGACCAVSQGTRERTGRASAQCRQKG